MDTKLRSLLEDAIENWIESICEDHYVPGCYYSPTLKTEMARAAEAVFDASFSGQEYFVREVGIETL